MSHPESVALPAPVSSAPPRPGWVRRHRWLLTSIVISVLLLAYFVPCLLAIRSLTVADRQSLSSTPAERGLVYEDVTFASREDDLLLSGWWIEGRAAGQQTIILIHGKDAVRDSTDYHYLDLMADLATGGYNVLAFDLRGHGESADARFTLGHDEPDDVLGAIDFLVARGVPMSEIALIGFSTGAVAALDAAVTEPEIAAVVADGAWPSLRELLEQEIPRQSPLPDVYTPGVLLLGRVLYGIDVDASQPISDVAALAATERPLLLIHSTEDRYTNEAQAHRLRDAAALDPQAAYWEIEGVEHVKGYVAYPDEYRETVLTFLDRAVKD